MSNYLPPYLMASKPLPFEEDTFEFNLEKNENIEPSSPLDPSLFSFLQEPPTLESDLDHSRFSQVRPIPKSENGINESLKKSNGNEDFLKELDDWKKLFDGILNEYKNIIGKHKDVLDFLKNFNNCRDELQTHFPSEDLNLIHDYLNAGYAGIKILKPLNKAALHAVKWFALQKAKKELDMLLARHKDELNEKKLPYSKDKIIAQCYKNLENEQQNAVNKSTNEILKLTTYHFVPLYVSNSINLLPNNVKKYCKLGCAISKESSELMETWGNRKIFKGWLQRLNTHRHVNIDDAQTLQHQLKNDIKIFLKNLKKCDSSEEAQDLLGEFDIVFDVPKDLSDWREILKNKKLKEFFSHQYQCHKGQFLEFDQNSLRSLLQKRENNERLMHFDRMLLSLEKLNFIYEGFTDLSITEIKAQLKDNHIDFEKIPNFPATKEEWNSKIVDIDFNILLCTEWVTYNETADRLLRQGIEVSLLLKINNESNILMFRGIEHVLSIIFIGFRMSSYIPGLQKGLERIYINPFLADLPIPAIGLLKILTPRYNFTLDGLFILAIHHCVGRYYKPHEYSMEGYYISFLISWSKLTAQIEFCLYHVKKILLALQTEFIEKLILKIQPTVMDERYDELKIALVAYNAKTKEYQIQLNQQLKQLKLKDLDTLLQPNDVKVSGPNGEENYSPLQNLIDTLKGVDKECLSESTLDYFKEHLGIDLKQEDEEMIPKQIEKFFTRSENDFFNSYKHNRENFLSNIAN
ncbi:MAG: hypothetical protein H0V82_08620 [Candidatus Protochlamydia sp.]|nr:hypothetical protein [Candidatus Protochlamydia sp.]